MTAFFINQLSQIRFAFRPLLICSYGSYNKPLLHVSLIKKTQDNESLPRTIACSCEVYLYLSNRVESLDGQKNCN